MFVGHRGGSVGSLGDSVSEEVLGPSMSSRGNCGFSTGSLGGSTGPPALLISNEFLQVLLETVTMY